MRFRAAPQAAGQGGGTIVYSDALAGSNSPGDGSVGNPYQTITLALAHIAGLPPQFGTLAVDFDAECRPSEQPKVASLVDRTNHIGADEVH